MVEVATSAEVVAEEKVCALCRPFAVGDGTFCSPTCERVSGEVLRLLRQRRSHLGSRIAQDFADAIDAAVELADIDERIAALASARRRAVALGAHGS